MSERVALPHTWRPVGARYAALVLGAVLVGAFIWMWFSFEERTKAAITPLEIATVIALVGLFLFVFYAMARSRVTASERGLLVVNGFRKRDLEWSQVVAVSMLVGAPWPTADLDDGTTISLLGIHGSDGRSAKAAVVELKRLVAEHSAAC